MIRMMLCGVVAMAACATDDLSYDAVTSIPAGSASGNWASGNYVVQRKVAACDPGCNTTQAGDEYHLCTMGSELTDPAIVTQVDGALSLSFQGTPGSFTLEGWDVETELPATMKGGIDTDASIRVGGAISSIRDPQTMLAGPMVRGRIDGKFDGASFAGHLRVYRLVTNYKGGWERVECNAEEDISMTRTSQ